MRAILKGAKFENEDVPNCYGCGKSGHLKNECLELTKASRKSNFNLNGNRKGRKVYISWEDNNNSSTQSEPDNGEIANLCLMGHKHHEVIRSDSESESNPSYEELQQAIVDMHDDAIKAFEKSIAQKKVILKLEAELSQLKHVF